MNKGGRPTDHPGEVKKAAIAVRTAPSIRDRLREAAKANGRSVTQEIEMRLVRSFDEDRVNIQFLQTQNRIAALQAFIEERL